MSNIRKFNIKSKLASKEKQSEGVEYSKLSNATKKYQIFVRLSFCFLQFVEVAILF
jgi:hypothetical protein